jgi:peptide-methionine (S)-S-oxide reductase
MRWRSLVLVAGLALCGVVRAAIPDFAGAPPKPATPGEATAVLAGGCFWGVDAVYKHLKGVKKVVSGYSGGSAATARYEIVGSGMTGHAESVEVTYDPSQIAYTDLLKVFFAVAHDPTELNRQGPDVGPQYRSAIFYANPQQKELAERYIAQLNAAKAFRKPIVTQVAALDKFYPAEAYHQNYLALHPTQPYIVYNDLPKLDALKKEFPDWYRVPPK